MTSCPAEEGRTVQAAATPAAAPTSAAPTAAPTPVALEYLEEFLTPRLSSRLCAHEPAAATTERKGERLAPLQDGATTSGTVLWDTVGAPADAAATAVGQRGGHHGKQTVWGAVRVDRERELARDREHGAAEVSYTPTSSSVGAGRPAHTPRGYESADDCERRTLPTVIAAEQHNEESPVAIKWGISGTIGRRKSAKGERDLYFAAQQNVGNRHEVSMAAVDGDATSSMGFLHSSQAGKQSASKEQVPSKSEYNVSDDTDEALRVSDSSVWQAGGSSGGSLAAGDIHADDCGVLRNAAEAALRVETKGAAVIVRSRGMKTAQACEADAVKRRRPFHLSSAGRQTERQQRFEDRGQEGAEGEAAAQLTSDASIVTSGNLINSEKKRATCAAVARCKCDRPATRGAAVYASGICAPLSSKQDLDEYADAAKAARSSFIDTSRDSSTRLAAAVPLTSCDWRGKEEYKGKRRGRARVEAGSSRNVAALSTAADAGEAAEYRCGGQTGGQPASVEDVEMVARHAASALPASSAADSSSPSSHHTSYVQLQATAVHALAAPVPRDASDFMFDDEDYTPSADAVDLCKLLLQKNFLSRPTATQALCHRWLQEGSHPHGGSSKTSVVGSSLPRPRGSWVVSATGAAQAQQQQAAVVATGSWTPKPPGGDATTTAGGSSATEPSKPWSATTTAPPDRRLHEGLTSLSRGGDTVPSAFAVAAAGNSAEPEGSRSSEHPGTSSSPVKESQSYVASPGADSSVLGPVASAVDAQTVSGPQSAVKESGRGRKVRRQLLPRARTTPKASLDFARRLSKRVPQVFQEAEDATAHFFRRRSPTQRAPAKSSRADEMCFSDYQQDVIRVRKAQ